LSSSTEKFRKALPASWRPVYEVLSRGNFIPTLVGGSVRDFYLTGNVGFDWDLELTHPTVEFTKDLWKQLGKDLHALGRTTYLPYDIIRLEIGKHQFEFSAPRVETYIESNQHKNFEAAFDLKAPFEKSVLRRDFTINAMGLRFHSDKNIELLDPLEGLRHLRDKLLYPAGVDFGKDPVRFLRALRFLHKLGFGLSSELEKILEQMDVTGFSATYLWNEMQKSGDPIGYYKELLDWQPTHPEMKLPVGKEFLSKIDEIKLVLKDPSFHEEWMIALEWVGIPCESWQTYFSLSSETCRRLGRWAECSKKFTSIQPEIFHGEFDEIKDKAEFEVLFDWYFTTKQLLQKNPNLPLLAMVENYLPAWIHLYRFEVVKDVKHIDPPLRAKYQIWNLCQRL
jgi:hypothetical protein